MSTAAATAASPAELEALVAEITRLGDSVKQLKTDTAASPDAVKAAVADLVKAKQAYSARNNGIGLDGKLDTSNMTKAEKKKALAAAKGDAVTEAGPAKPVRTLLAAVCRMCAEEGCAPLAPRDLLSTFRFFLTHSFSFSFFATHNFPLQNVTS